MATPLLRSAIWYRFLEGRHMLAQPGSLPNRSANGSQHTASVSASPLPPSPLPSSPGLPLSSSGEVGGAGASTDLQDAGGDALIGIEEVQKSLNRSRASVYRYTNTDPRNLNPPFNPRKLNPEYRSDQKEPLMIHPNEVARFARDILRIKEVTVEVLNSPSTATQQLLASILDELRAIRHQLDLAGPIPADLDAHRQQHDRSRPAA